MPLKLLQRILKDNPDVTDSPLALEIYWDLSARRRYPTQLAAGDAPAFELPVDTEVDRWALPNGKTRVVLYDGDGRVRTENLAAGASGGISGPGTNIPPLVVPERALVTADLNGNQAGPNDGYVKVFGQGGIPPYQLSVETLNGTVLASATRRTATLPLECFDLAPGGTLFAISVDATGSRAVTEFPVVLGAPTGIPYSAIISDIYQGNGTQGQGTRVVWNFATKQIEIHGYSTGADDDGLDYRPPANSFVDGYLLADGVTFRTVRVGAGPDNDYVYFEEASTGVAAGSTLTLDNIILFHPDTPTHPGGFLLEMNATAPPLTFALPGYPSNATGSFDGLPAGDYPVTVTDALGSTLAVTVSLRLRYALRWYLNFDDLYGVPCRQEWWLRDYVGPAEAICGQGERPIVLKSDGLSSSLGGQGDLPPVVGSSCEMNLLVPPGLFESVVIGDDRNCRTDSYRAGKLEFRGYVQPDIYHAPLLDGLQPTGLTATDGLAALKDTDFLGHEGQRLQGRRPILNTVLHALSRCQIALPLRLFVNRRDTTMSDADAPELAATTERNGYWDESKSEPLDLRTVADALAQLLGGTLCQREGQWQVRSPLEAALPAPGRAYLPAGTAQPAVVAPAPSATVLPPDGADLYWLDANQNEQVRPAWKSLAGSTDVGWLENAFPYGEVFSDPYAWLENKNQLRPLSGWQPGLGQPFPLVLVRAGEKGTDYRTQWPRGSANDPRVLVSPPLPLVPIPEACPAYLVVSAALVSPSTLPGGAPSADAATQALLVVELVVDGQRPQAPLTVSVPLAKSATEKASVLTLPLPPLPPGATQGVLYVHPWVAVPPNLVQSDGTAYPVYEPRTSYEAGGIVRYDAGEGEQFYQAKTYVFAGRKPGALPLDTRPYTVHTNFAQGQYATQGGSYYRALRNLYDPLPPLPVSGLDINWQLTPRAEIGDDNWLPLSTATPPGQLLVASIGVQLRPREATWDGADNFRADGPGGTVRPTEVQKTFHPDPPASAGLFAGNIHAFSKAVALADGTVPTGWARSTDLAPSPVFEANVLDTLALRAGASRLLGGTIRHESRPPVYLLDSLDVPTDIAGRRFLVGSTEWDMKAAEVAVSPFEIGAGADAPDPMQELPDGARVIHRAYEYTPGKYTPVPRFTQTGRVRVRQPR